MFGALAGVARAKKVGVQEEIEELCRAKSEKISAPDRARVTRLF
jgi:hypothetical protein